MVTWSILTTSRPSPRLGPDVVLLWMPRGSWLSSVVEVLDSFRRITRARGGAATCLFGCRDALRGRRHTAQICPRSLFPLAFFVSSRRVGASLSSRPAQPGKNDPRHTCRLALRQGSRSCPHCQAASLNLEVKALGSPETGSVNPIRHACNCKGWVKSSTGVSRTVG